MPKYFPSVSHQVVRTVPDTASIDTMKGMIAFVDIYLGPGEECISNIGIQKMPGPVQGVQAHIPKTPVITNGRTSYVPVITGAAAMELKMLALQAFDRVKSKFGLKFGKFYGVDAKNVEEVEKK